MEVLKLEDFRSLEKLMLTESVQNAYSLSTKCTQEGVQRRVQSKDEYSHK